MFGSNNFMNMSDPSFLSTTETFHTPSLGDEDLEIPPMSALGDPSEELGLPGVDSTVVDGGGVVVQAFGGSLQPVAGGGVSDIGRTAIGVHPGGGGGAGGGGVIGGDFSPHFPPAQGLELPSLAIGGGLLSAEPALLEATLDMDTSPYVHAHSPHMSMAGLIHQPPQLQLQQHQQQQQQQQHQQQQQPQRTTLQLRSHSLAGSHGGLSGPLVSMGIPHGQLTTIDQSHLGLGHGSPSPPSSKSPTPSPCSSLEPAEDPEEAARVALEKRQLVELQRKVKPSKRKKKKDPNEPLKPLSAYALFFRDTQAAIKGQNASATFGEVSKIVASMWDSLGEEQKQVYKRKAEAAKKDYLKALAAYKDGLLPQAALDPTDSELLSALHKSPGAPPAHIVLAPAATPMPPPLQPMPQVMMRPVVATHANASGGGGGRRRRRHDGRGGSGGDRRAGGRHLVGVRHGDASSAAAHERPALPPAARRPAAATATAAAATAAADADGAADSSAGPHEPAASLGGAAAAPADPRALARERRPADGAGDAPGQRQ
ncbi:TOX high mobility group box family member 3-like [Lampetra planeri]